MELAGQHHFELPAAADARRLEEFRGASKPPIRFPDLSLAVIKSGPGEYVAEFPGETVLPGHFGLAVADYAHSTAPNRRYPDVITQRLLKAALASAAIPYSPANLEDLAKHCTEEEDAAKKVERQVAKSAAALLLAAHIGQQFDAIITGASVKGTWVASSIHPSRENWWPAPTASTWANASVCNCCDTDVEQGFIDFKRVALSHNAGDGPTTR